jgi:hypothetical protein
VCVSLGRWKKYKLDFKNPIKICKPVGDVAVFENRKRIIKNLLEKA